MVNSMKETAAVETEAKSNECRDAAATRIREMSKGVKLGGIKLKELVNEGRGESGRRDVLCAPGWNMTEDLERDR